MADAQKAITFEDKEDRRLTDLPRKYKIVADDMNQLKSAINNIYDSLALAVIPIAFTVTAADFEGNTYTNMMLVNKTPMVDFYIQTNDGSGTLLSLNNGFTFNSNTGVVEMTAANYYITIYKKLL